MTQNIRN